MLDLFHVLVAVHIGFGSVGLVSFWPALMTRKGSPAHIAWGRVFQRAILGAGGIALCLSILTLIDPAGTHPHIDDPVFVHAVFGVMMLMLATLTINLAWHGRASVEWKADHARHRRGINLWLQPALIATSCLCVWEAFDIGQPLMALASIVGFATAGTNLAFILNPDPLPRAWLSEHIKAIVGCGISVYTAFFAFGAVRIAPALALHPLLWAIPLVVGLWIIIHHWRTFRLEPIRILLEGMGFRRGRA